MKRLLLFAGLAGALTLTTFAQAVPDPKVDKPSFGRIVYGMTGGKVILPKDAWEGYYPDGSGTNAVPGDLSFNGLAIVAGVQTRYLGDALGAITGVHDYAWVVANPGAVNASVVAGGIITDQPESATKLGFISRDGWESKVSMFTPPSVSALTTLFGIHTNAGATVGPPLGYTVPFGLAYTTPTNTYYSDIPANNSGAGADTYNHVKIFRVTDITNDYYGHYFAGFEDLNFLPSPSPSYQRFDWNDTVIELVPEPAFYQMAGVLGLGALGLFRMRRRSSK